MNPQRKTIFAFGVATATISVALITLPAIATPSYGGFAPSPLSFGTFGPIDIKAEKDGKWDLRLKSKGQTDVRVTRVAFPAGSSSGWHSHPGPNLLTVTLGSVVVYDSSNPLCTGTTYTKQTVTVPTGGTFYDNGGSAVHLVRNETGAPAEIMAVAFYPHGVTPLTDSTKPKPTNGPATVL